MTLLYPPTDLTDRMFRPIKKLYLATEKFLEWVSISVVCPYLCGKIDEIAFWMLRDDGTDFFFGLVVPDIRVHIDDEVILGSYYLRRYAIQDIEREVVSLG